VFGHFGWAAAKHSDAGDVQQASNSSAVKPMHEASNVSRRGEFHTYRPSMLSLPRSCYKVATASTKAWRHQLGQMLIWSSYLWRQAWYHRLHYIESIGLHVNMILKVLTIFRPACKVSAPSLFSETCVWGKRSVYVIWGRTILMTSPPPNRRIIGYAVAQALC